MSNSCKQEMVNWCNVGNPSASYTTAQSARMMMVALQKTIGKVARISTCCTEERDKDTESDVEKIAQPNIDRFRVVFTSGASEGNATMIRSVTDAYKLAKRKIGHVVLSSIEHKSLLDEAIHMRDSGLIRLTLVQPTSSGHIMPEDVKKAIASDTCLVCVMHANNETGAINDIAAIGKIAHTANVPVHCDVVQTFGKIPLNPLECNVDSFTMSFHKMYGPPGCGALVIREKLLDGYKLAPLIFGSQNTGFRGGTENVPGLGSSLMALRTTFTDRMEKNKHLQLLKKTFILEMSSRFPVQTFVNYVSDKSKIGGKKVADNSQGLPAIEIVFLSGLSVEYLPNTILFSIVKRTLPPMCNSKMKKELESAGIIISVGSACNTASTKASHVLYAMEADDLIRKGALRISFGDYNTIAEVQKCVFVLTSLINKLA